MRFVVYSAVFILLRESKEEKQWRQNKFTGLIIYYAFNTIRRVLIKVHDPIFYRKQYQPNPAYHIQFLK